MSRQESIDKLIQLWEKRNICGFYCPDGESAVALILERINAADTVGLSGSVTLEKIGIVKRLESRGNKVFNQYRPGLSRQESLEMRRQGSLADYYLTSANALSLEGELVFFSAFGLRTAGISAAKQTIVVCGRNKITDNIDQALKRARVEATPLNCKRLNWNAPCLPDKICRSSTCQAPQFKRMCCQLLIVEAEAAPGRLTVILADEELGY